MIRPLSGRRWRVWLLAPLGLGLLIGGALLADAWSAFGGRATRDRMARMVRSPQWAGDRFANPLPEKMDMWRATTKWLKGAPNREPGDPPPIMKRRAKDFEMPPASGLRITWLGHSTSLVEIDGHRILLDPVFGPRASPSRFYGPKRFHEPPLPLAELPHLDAIVLSHDHYDHLDEPTIAQLAHLDVRFFVPLGLGAHLESWGVAPERITELDWWEEAPLGPLRLVATPARHFSGRGLFDRNATLWASWTVIGPAHRIFFSGDTAMFPGFAEIGERFGPFDATLIEVGAYDEAWADVHIGPEQAIEAHQALQGAVMFPVHWGTFNLALHAWIEPAERVLIAAERAGVRVVTPKAGESIEPAAPPPIARWWPELPWRSAEQNPIVSSGIARTDEPATEEAYSLAEPNPR